MKSPLSRRLRGGKVSSTPNVSKRCWLTFPTRNQVEQPIIWRMSQAFPKVVFDIRQASVQNEIGIMAVLFVGPGPDVVAALSFLREAGLTVEPIEKSVVEG
jgi:NIL domain